MMPAFRFGTEVRSAAVIVAHPDDETIWCGGLMLLNAQVAWEIVALCRGDDPDRAPRFVRACAVYGAASAMACLDDGPDQRPLADGLAEAAALELLRDRRYDLILTHGPRGEYTRHLRHEETHRAVHALIMSCRLDAGRALAFAYDDAGGVRTPRASEDAELMVELPAAVHTEKLRIVQDIYGFGPGRYEYAAAVRVEAFNTLAISGKVSR